MTYEEAHRIARERGPSRLLYTLVRSLVVPFFRLWFRLRITGAEHIPARGAAIIMPNHKSFWDAFFIGAATRRRVRFMGKVELFEAPYGRLLVALGAFPVRRGQSDAVAHETARIILEQGGLLSLFPEGTRVREPAALGAPRRSAARLAIEAGARRSSRRRSRAPNASASARSRGRGACRWPSAPRSRSPSSRRRPRRPAGCSRSSSGRRSGRSSAGSCRGAARWRRPWRRWGSAAWRCAACRRASGASRGQPWWRQTPKARIRLPRRRSRPRLSLRGRRKRR